MKSILLIIFVVLLARINTQVVNPTDNCLVFDGYCK